MGTLSFSESAELIITATVDVGTSGTTITNEAVITASDQEDPEVPGHVTSLFLSFNQLSGSIPAELGNLSNLTGLILSSNQLSGGIPVELGNLSALTRLGLVVNQLSGSIPVDEGKLVVLTRIGQTISGGTMSDTTG